MGLPPVRVLSSWVPDPDGERHPGDCGAARPVPALAGPFC